MWWHGGAGLTERSERGSFFAVFTHDVFASLLLLRRWSNRFLDFLPWNSNRSNLELVKIIGQLPSVFVRFGKIGCDEELSFVDLNGVE